MLDTGRERERGREGELRSTWTSGDGGLSPSRDEEENKKLKCLVPGCNGVFDDDYRNKTNVHVNLLKAKKLIPYEIEGAPAFESFFGDRVQATRKLTRIQHNNSTGK